MPASQDIVDETTIRLAFNATLFRDATAKDISDRLATKQTYEQLQRELLASGERKAVAETYDKGKTATSTFKPYTGQQLFTRE